MFIELAWLGLKSSCLVSQLTFVFPVFPCLLLLIFSCGSSFGSYGIYSKGIKRQRTHIQLKPPPYWISTLGQRLSTNKQNNKRLGSASFPENIITNL